MAKEKDIHEDESAANPASRAQSVARKAEAMVEAVMEAAAEKSYVGPAYKTGIVLPGTSDLLRPATMTPVERDALIKRYPAAASWWA